MMNFQKMMQQAQEMQFKLQEMQSKFQELEVSGEAGAGMVKVVMNCRGEVKSLEIDPAVMDDKETLEDLVVAAVNNANAAKDAKVEDETKAMMKDMGLPEGAAGGLGGGLPF